MPSSADKIAHPILRYYGGKWRLATWIIAHFPPHVCYCEPFAGAASVLLKKEPSDTEVYNDLDQNVVTFFRMMRDQPKELFRVLRATPYSRSEFLQSYEPSADPLEAARRLYAELFKNWTRVETTAQTMNKTTATELLYLSPRVAQQLNLSP